MCKQMSTYLILVDIRNCRSNSLPNTLYDPTIFSDVNTCMMTSSCQNNCGDVKVYSNNVTALRCSCDKLCSIYGDCCADFGQFCPAEAQRGVEINANNYKYNKTCDFYDDGEFEQISSCPWDPSACIKNHSNAFDLIPVFDLDTGIDYVNARCAQCNDVTNGVLWDFEVNCFEGNFTNETTLDFNEVVFALRDRESQCRIAVYGDRNLDRTKYPLRRCLTDGNKANGVCLRTARISHPVPPRSGR